MTTTYIGHSLDESIRFKSSSGGIVTTIVKYLFDIKYIGTFLGCTFDEFRKEYVPTLVQSYEDYELVGSVYQDMDLVGFIRSHKDLIIGRLLVVCAPCQVKPIRHILKEASIDSIIIDYFCSGQTTIEGTYKYYELLGLNKSDVKLIRYRGNGWPNGIEIETIDGRLIKKDNYSEPWKTLHQSYIYRPKRCHFCRMVESTDADISVGDPWLKDYLEQEKIGANLFLVHSDFGQKLINIMNQQHLVHIEETSYNLFIKSQWHNVRAKQAVAKRKIAKDKVLSIISNPQYFNWATRNLRTIRLHIKLVACIFRYYNLKESSLKENAAKFTKKLFNIFRG